MNKNILQLNKIIQLGIGVLILGVFLIPYTSKAVSAPLTYPNYYRFQDITVHNGTKYIGIYSDVYVSLSKNFNLVSGGQNLNLSATIAQGSNITSNSSKTTGSFNLGGSAMGTPPLDGYLYYRYENLVWRDSINGGMDVAVSWAMPFGGIVVDNTTYTLSSNNSSVISCSGTTCSAVGPGSATITVNWAANNEYYTVGLNRFYIGPAYNGSTQYPEAFAGAWVNGETTVQNFSVSPISYNITVPTPPPVNPPPVNPPPVNPPPVNPPPVNPPPVNPPPVNPPPVNPPPVNPPPTPVVQVSNVRAENITLTTAIIRWNYTHSLGYPQQSSQVQVATDAGFTNIVINQGQLGTSTSVPISGLTANTTYYIRVKATDNITSLNSQPWVVGPPFTTKSYPALTIDYNLKSGTQTVGKGSTIPLTVKTGENVNAVWNITDADGGIVDGLVGTCNIASVGFNAIGGTGLPLSSSKSAAAPDSPIDKTYTINLSCAAKPGGIAVNETIPLKVESYPLISCSVIKKVVSGDDPTAQVEGEIRNANAPYTWWVKKNIGEAYGSPITNNNTKQSFNLDYTGLGLGKYTPVIQAKGNGGRTAEKECSEGISNLGNRSIREIAP